jgi:outer membrane protein OmpA-like peptidoglycan-associated protein
MVVLVACQNVDEDTTGAEMAAREPSGYPSLHTVPPRPQLSYTVEQRRAIVDGLIADRENARYTSEVVRYRTGLSSMPPPDPRTLAAIPLTSEPQEGDAAPAPAAEPSGRPDADASTAFMDLDDDLGSFMDEMLEVEPARQRRTAPGGEPGARAEPQGGKVVRPAAAPSTPGRDVPATIASSEDAPAPPPAPIKPQPASAIDVANETALEGERREAASAAQALALLKPSPGISRIEVADGLIAIAGAAGEGDDTAVGSIAFGPGSAALPPDAQRRLERLLDEANAQGARVKIVGEAAAPALALDRARAIGLALVQRGLPADRLEMTLAAGAAGDRARLFLASPQAP